MNPKKRTLISSRLLPELKKELQEEATAYDMTLSSYCEWIFQNRPFLDEEGVHYWQHERDDLLQRVKLLEVSLRAMQRMKKLKSIKFNQLPDNEEDS